MYLEMFLRIFSDCCIFFALLGCCPSLLPYSYPLPAVALICGLAAGLSSFFGIKGWRKLSRACALLPLLSLLLANGWQEMLILIPAILYTGAILFRDQMYLEYYGYRDFFKRTLIILAAVWAIISAAVYFEDPQGLQEQLIHTEVILQYVILFFLCGVILQRQLRLGAQNRNHGETSQILGMVGCVGVVGIGFVLTEPLLRESGFDLLRKIASILTLPFAVIFEGFALLISKLDEMYQSEEYQKEYANSEAAGEPLYTDYQDYMKELLEDAPEPSHSPWIMVISAIAVLIILVLMFLAFTKLRGSSGSPLIVSEVKDTEKKKRFSRLSNRGKVRQLYRDFLRHERSHGLRIKSQYTTADILRRISSDTNREAASDLRDVYLRARYDDVHEVARTEVVAAREAMKNIRKPK